jgi:hypothetical protein
MSETQRPSEALGAVSLSFKIRTVIRGRGASIPVAMRELSALEEDVCVVVVAFPGVSAAAS